MITGILHLFCFQVHFIILSFFSRSNIQNQASVANADVRIFHFGLATD